MPTKLATRSMQWEGSTSEDAQGYKIYYCPESESLSFDSPSVDVGDVETVRLPQDVPAFAGMDGSFRVAIAAYDDCGNEEMGPESILPLDFVAPTAPGAPILV